MPQRSSSVVPALLRLSKRRFISGMVMSRWPSPSWSRPVRKVWSSPWAKAHNQSSYCRASSEGS